MRLTLLAESFNVTNRLNQRVTISDDGYLNSAGQFVAYSTQVGKTLYAGEFVTNSKFLMPTNSYAPRQVQLSIKASFESDTGPAITFVWALCHLNWGPKWDSLLDFPSERWDN